MHKKGRTDMRIVPAAFDTEAYGIVRLSFANVFH